MEFTLVGIFFCSILGLMAHAARRRQWLEMVVRAILVMICSIVAITYFGGSITADKADALAQWSVGVNGYMALAAFAILFLPVRKVLSRILTIVDGIVSLRIISGPLRHKMKPLDAMVDRIVFIPTSFPHLVGTFLFILVFGFSAASTNMPGGFNLPSIPMPASPIPFESLFSYNGFGLITMSFCGIGILVSRKWRESLLRLGWQKPTLTQVAIGITLILFTFSFDLVFSLSTHNSGQDMATKISSYNSGTFAVDGTDFTGSLILAFATALCAGIGEETLIRGALQPVVGILPAALLHGILHAQFANAPILILQIALWSCIMGIVRRCTNTTTTIIGHVGFNFVSVFLFAFNP